MRCISFSNNYGFNLQEVSSDASWAVLTNNSGSNFSINITRTNIPGKINPCGDFVDVYFLVIMNPSLTDFVTIASENGNILETKPFTYQCGSGFVGTKTSPTQKNETIKINFKKTNSGVIPENYIKIIVTTSLKEWSVWPAMSSADVDGFYVTDIGREWMKVANYAKIDEKITYSQKAYLRVENYFSEYVAPVFFFDVKNNLPYSSINKVNVIGTYNKGEWTEKVSAGQQKIITGLVDKPFINLSYNSVEYNPTLSANVESLIWRRYKTAPFVSYNQSFDDFWISNGSFDDQNRYVQVFSKKEKIYQGRDRRYDYQFVIVANDEVYIQCSVSYNQGGCEYNHITGRYDKNCRYYDGTYYVSGTGTGILKDGGSFYINKLFHQGEVISFTLPDVRSNFGFSGKVVVSPFLDTSPFFTPSPSSSPSPTPTPSGTQATPTPTPSPSKSPGPTPSPSGTGPTATPFPTITPLPTVLPGRMWFAGDNSDGTLGTNNTINYSSPVQSVAGGLWQQVSAGNSVGNSIAAIKDDGTLWIWGLARIGPTDTISLSSPVQVAGGGTWLQVNNSMGLKSDGTIWIWNQVGTTPLQNASSPSQVTSLGSNWIYFDTADGLKYTVSGIRNDRTAWVVGSNTYGELGINSTSSIIISSPVQTVFRTNDWQKINTGFHFYRIALKTDGTIWTWGNNQYGQLGLGNTFNASTPTQVGSDSSWIDIAATAFNSYAIKQDGTFWGIGGSVIGSSPIQYINNTNIKWNKIVSVSETNGNSFILFDNQNRAYSWSAYNEFGQMGDNQTWGIPPFQPLQLFTAGTNTQWLTGTNKYGSEQFAGLSAYNVLIEDVNPTVTLSSTPSPTPSNSTSPTPTPTDPSPTPTPTIATATPTPSVTESATPTQSPSATPTSTPTLSPQPTPTPSNSATPFPTGSPSPTPTPTLPPLIFSDGNYLINFTSFISENTQTIVFSNASYNSIQPYLNSKFLQNGYMTLDITTLNSEVILNPLGGTVIVNLTGDLVDSQYFDLVDGSNIFYQGQVSQNGFIAISPNASLGTIDPNRFSGSISFSTLAPEPTQTPPPSLPPLESVNGKLFIWGNNAYGQLGADNDLSSSSPVQTLASSTDWNSCDIKFNHILSVKDNGQLWAWGNNTYGQLGLNNTVDVSSPVQTIIDKTDWNFVSAGYWFSLAANNKGELWTWGRNNFGQLGNNTVIDTSSPVIVNLSQIYSCKKLSAGYTHAAAILSNNNLYLWGDNTYGACGFIGVNSISYPTQIILDAPEIGWDDVTCGKYFTLAVRKDGKIYGWGLNSDGQLGTNTVQTYSNPVLIESGSSKWNFISAGEKFSVGGVNLPIGTPVPTVTSTPSPTPSASLDFPTPTPT